MKFEKLLLEWTPAIRPELKLRAKGAKPVENRLSGLKERKHSLRLKEPSPAGRLQLRVSSTEGKSAKGRL